jgi:hypothetical protein
MYLRAAYEYCVPGDPGDPVAAVKAVNKYYSINISININSRTTQHIIDLNHLLLLEVPNRSDPNMSLSKKYGPNAPDAFNC